MIKKLLALNLALFFIVWSAIPIFAVQNSKDEKVYKEEKSYSAQQDMLVSKKQTMSEHIQETLEYHDNSQSVDLYASNSSGYNIVVNGYSFSSRYDSKGNGWKYKSSSNTLFLDGYSGSGIRASGDLVVYAEGVNQISGSTGTYYGSAGIISSGNLEITIASGTTYVHGGGGYTQGGDGISSDITASIYTLEGSSLFVTGGDTSDTSRLGGDAIYGKTVYILGDGFVSATGGDGLSVYSKNCSGGCGIIGNYIYLLGSCELVGGNGYYAGPGIYFGSYCQIGVVNATISCGNGQYNKYAIQNSDELSWYYNKHTVLSGNSSSIKISIRQYTLRLLGCGGTIGTATYESLKSYYPTSYDLSEYVFQRTGYTQVSWSNASGDLIPLHDLYTPVGNTDLYAVWEINKYKVEYVVDGATAPKNQVKVYGEPITLSECVPEKVGYTFKGWSTKQNGNVTYNSGDEYRNNEDVTLYAVWEIIKYTISYDANGGIGAPESQTKTYGTNLTLSSVVPEREGYNFKGWSTIPNGGVDYNPGDEYTENADIVLYAIWEINKYSVEYNANGGLFDKVEQTKTYDIDLVLHTEKPTREGHKFHGWATTENGEPEYQSGAVYSKNESVTLYAVWEINKYNVKYTVDGATAPESQVKVYGEPLTLSEEVPAKEHYAFLGWSTIENGEVVYNPGDKYTENADIVLYAVWKDLKGDVSGDGELAQEDITMIADAILGATLTEEQLKYGNVYTADDGENGEPVINIKDLIKLAQMMTQNK